MATTYVVQMDGIGVGLTSPANSTVSAITPQLKLDVLVTRTVVIEPNNVGVSSGGATGGVETSVVF
jgi:hypothetical protein